MRILFTSDSNGYESINPHAWLVDVFKTSTRIMKALEESQVGAGRTGGSWTRIMEDGNIPHELIKKGRLDELSKENYDEKYKLISGNY